MISYEHTQRRFCAGLLAFLLLLAAWPAMAEKPQQRARLGRAAKAQQAPPSSAIGLFAAIGSRQATATLTAHGSSQCTVRLANNTNRPLELTLPEVFSASPLPSAGPSQTLGSGFPSHLVDGGPAVPAADAPAPAEPHPDSPPARRFTPPPAAQRDLYVRYGAGMWVLRRGASRGSTGAALLRVPQRRGRPAAPPGPDAGAAVAWTLSLAPRSTRRFKLPALCLEQSKASPGANAAYRIRPIESFTQKVAVHEVCRLLARGAIDQRTAQSAAWDLLAGTPLTPEVTAILKAARAKVPSGGGMGGKSDSLSRY